MTVVCHRQIYDGAMTNEDKAAAWDQLTVLVAALRRMLLGIPLDGADKRDATASDGGSIAADMIGG